MSENVLQLPQSIVVVDGESISREHLQREHSEGIAIQPNVSRKVVQESCCTKRTTKVPADVVDGATGERRKMMRAQLRGARQY